ALAAAHVRRDERLRALAQPRVAAGGHDRARDLVPRDAPDGAVVAVGAVLTRGDPQVGAADPAGRHLEHRLAGAGLGLGPLLDAQILGPAVRECLHRAHVSSSLSSTGRPSSQERFAARTAAVAARPASPPGSPGSPLAIASTNAVSSSRYASPKRSGQVRVIGRTVPVLRSFASSSAMPPTSPITSMPSVPTTSARAS